MRISRYFANLSKGLTDFRFQNHIRTGFSQLYIKQCRIETAVNISDFSIELYICEQE